MADITMWNLPPSPNNMKVRVALNYKGLDFDRVDVGFEDRDAVVEASGQPLTPVIKHGNTVVYDSRAILRYLDTNFRDTPRLLVGDRPAMLELERAEAYAREVVSPPIGIIFGELTSGGEPDVAACAEASRRLNEATAPYEEALQDREFLMGDHITLADVTAAPFVWYGMVPDELGGADNPFMQGFIDLYKLGDGRDKTREWAQRVMAYDR